MTLPNTSELGVYQLTTWKHFWRPQIKLDQWCQRQPLWNQSMMFEKQSYSNLRQKYLRSKITLNYWGPDGSGDILETD